MGLKERIRLLMQTLNDGIVEREVFLQIIFLSILTNRPIYVCGRKGSGKSLLVSRVKQAFFDNKTLRFGRRFFTLPEKFDNFDMVHFRDFDGENTETKKALQIVFQEFNGKPILITGHRRPESALSEAGIIDSITIAVNLPDTISAKSLKQLLTSQYDEDSFNVPKELQIKPEEKKEWLTQIKKIKISEDVLDLIGRISDTCAQNQIYISISKWKGLLNILKTMAYCNERNEVILTDAFILGMPIWTRSRNKNILIPEFFNHFESILLKDIPIAENVELEAEQLRSTAEHLLNATADIYETVEYAKTSCVKYSVTIAGETVPLYAPEEHIGTHESFHPFNELRQKEKRVLCNFNGSSICSISIDSSVKGVGLRSMASTTAGKSYEHFARLPAKVIEINNQEKLQNNQKAFEDFRHSLDVSVENYAAAMIQLKSIYKSLKTYTEDPFFNSEYYHKIQGIIKYKFEQSNKMIQLLKEVRLFMDAPLPKN